MFTAAGKSAASSSAVYVEDVFSTYVYTGTSANRSIVNNIDLAGKGGLVWIKDRNIGLEHTLFDTSRGVNKYLSSNYTNAEATAANSLTAFNSNGFNLGTNASFTNVSPYNYVGWTFREQAKFFDIVTYTGTGTARTVAHNLGSVPGMMIVKRIGAVGEWNVYHRSLATNQYLTLESTAAISTSASYWNNTAPTSTEFSVSSVNNTNGNTYVAYLFAHNAGGFGATGSDNVISCGSFTTDGSGNASVNLGYEPQFIINKATVGGYSWEMGDSMRGLISFSTGYYSRQLKANLVNTEGNYTGYVTSTGFEYRSGATNTTYIYIAIRRGPMKTPTSSTSVFSPVIGNSSSPSPYIGFTTSFTLDAALYKARAGSVGYEAARLTSSLYLQTSSNAAEASSVVEWDRPTGFGLGSNVDLSNYIGWMFQRAPGFFDVVCYTGTGSTRTVTHNLGVAPELVIYKARDFTADWVVYAQPITASNLLSLNTTAAQNSSVASYWNGVAPTSTNLTVVSNNGINGSGLRYIAYLFATLAGVSKVGSYTGTGALQTINCGFSSGARFVLIKRADSTGDWWVYDSTRGITSGNDPYLFLNDTAAEVTNTNYVDTTSVGFQVTAAAPAGLNANGGTYIFLAIA